MKRLTKETKGITLIALVITIVVLIILAAIMINITLGENGLFTRAKLGASQYNEVQAKEQVQVMLTDYMVRKETDEPNLQLSTFLDEQKTNGKIQGYTDNEDGTVTIEVAGQEVKVNKTTLKIKEENEGQWSYNHATQTVTNGTLTLKIGDYIVDSDTQNVDGFNGQWRVLGVENGQLLLMSNNEIPIVESDVKENNQIIDGCSYDSYSRCAFFWNVRLQ